MDPNSPNIITNRDYRSINRPYDKFLNRTGTGYSVNPTNTYSQPGLQSLAQTNPASGNISGINITPGSTTGGVDTTNGSVEQMPVKSEGAMSDLWIDKFIRSSNWQPKSVGFYIDGQTGYAEFSNVFVSGNIQAQTGSIGGFEIENVFIEDVADTFGLSSDTTGVGPYVRLWAGASFLNRANAPFVVYSDGSIKGTGITVSKIDIPDTITTKSFHVDSAGNAWWGAIGIGSATAKILNTGVATFTALVTLSNVTITGGNVATATLNKGIQSWTTNIVFSSVSANQINWSGGTIQTQDSQTYSINSGNTGGMSALTYIYLDTNVSSTVLQITTSFSVATGDNKILIAAASNGAVSASVIPYGGQQPIVTGDNIVASSILAANIAVGSVTANKINVGTLSAISVNLGSITAGTITGISIIGSTFRTATSGQRIELNVIANEIDFYDPGGTLTGEMHANGGMLLNSKNSNNIVITAAAVLALQAGTNVQCSANFLIPGSIFVYRSVNQPIVYFGTCVSGSSSVSDGNITWGIVHNSTGVYTVSHGLGVSNYAVVATIQRGTTLEISIQAKTTGSFTVRTASSTTVTDSNFQFILTKGT